MRLILYVEIKMKCFFFFFPCDFCYFCAKKLCSGGGENAVKGGFNEIHQQLINHYSALWSVMFSPSVTELLLTEKVLSSELTLVIQSVRRV